MTAAMTGRCPWIAQSYAPLPGEPKLRLLCLPWAGGNSSIYADWPSALQAAGIEVLPLELPGRASRGREKPYEEVGTLVGDLAEALLAETALLGDPKTPFAIFGHSFGALCAYELASALASRQPARPPALLIVSAAPAPHFAGSGSWPLEAVSGLPQRELVDYLAGKGNALPEEILADPEVSAYFFGAIRADYGALEKYQPKAAPTPLPCPVQVYGGEGDIPEDKLAAWSGYSTHAVDVRMHPGGHFYIQGAGQRGAVLAHLAGNWDTIGDPHEDTLEAVATAAQSVLGLRAAPKGDLLQVGLSSLDGMALAAEIRARLAVGLAPDDVLRRTIVTKLARFVDLRMSLGANAGPPPLLPGVRHQADQWHPVSYQQEQMIFMYEVQPSAYNMPTTLDFRGPFDLGALRRALRALCVAQETLRTVIKMDEGGVMKQRVLGPDQADDCYELREIVVATEEEAAKAIEEDAVRVFSLEEPPAFRATVVQGWDASRRYVLLNQHHLGSDGWTRMETRKQLCLAYVAYASGGEDSGLRPPPLS